MIIPYLSGILFSFKRAPVIWSLFLSNIFLFLVFSIIQPQTDFKAYFENENFLVVQGQNFARFISAHENQYSLLHRKLADTVLVTGKKGRSKILGHLSMRDVDFIKNAKDFPFTGDLVAIERWREDFLDLRQMLATTSSFKFGLHEFNNGWFSYISYQFIHGGFFHVLVNMWFLLVFGFVIEPLIGSAFTLVLYLTTGVFGALFFVWTSGLSAVPLVGASGAVSGLMGFFSVVYWGRFVKFFYWILPFKGYSGFVYLPTWVTLVMWVGSDLAGILSTVSVLGGVAHAAHIGGVLSGSVYALLFLAWRKSSSHSVLRYNSGL